MPNYSVPSQDELPKGQRVVFPGGEDYLLTVLAITPTVKNDFNGNPQDVLTFKFSIDSFADEAPLEDVDGATTDAAGQALAGKWIWKDIDPKRMGFQQNGTPSLSRQCLLSLNGISDMTDRVPDGNTDDLIGRKVIGTFVVKARKDGGKGNNITAFKPVKRRRGGRADQPVSTQTVAGAPLLPVPSAPTSAVAQTRGQSPEEEAFSAAVTNIIENDSVEDLDVLAVKAFMDDD